MKSTKENLVRRKITYTLENEGKFYIVENVPAMVNDETGEQYFEPKIVERLQKTVLKNKKPIRTISTPVYDFDE